VAWGPGSVTCASGSRFSFSLELKLVLGQCGISRAGAARKMPAGKANFWVDSYPMMSYRKGNKGGVMAVDFEALDLVRSENRSRSYNKRLDDLARENQELGDLVADAIACVVELEKPSHIGRSTTLKERFEKIKKRG